MMNIDIAYLETDNGKSPYLEWEKKLDISVRAVVRSRINRVRLGNFGDFHSINGVSGFMSLEWVCCANSHRKREALSQAPTFICAEGIAEAQRTLRKKWLRLD